MDARKHLENAIRQLLRPLVRILLRQGLSFNEFAELAKREFMEIAWDEFTPEGSRPSDSRVAIMTGLTRKEVKRLREMRNEADSDEHQAQYKNRASRVLSGWYRDPEFCGDDGAPRTLPMDGDDNSFAQLVKRYSGDMPPRAMLDELKRVGAVTALDDGQIQVNSRSYVPSADDPEVIRLFGDSVSDLINTWSHNLEAQNGDKWLQRHVRSPRVSKRAIPLFKRLARDNGQQFLETLEDWLLSHEPARSSDARDDKTEVGVGIYFFDRSEVRRGDQQ
ncbi:hypothetical protein GYB61_06100 [bacterium]|nr:hypothetical protein [bacterium]